MKLAQRRATRAIVYGSVALLFFTGTVSCATETSAGESSEPDGILSDSEWVDFRVVDDPLADHRSKPQPHVSADQQQRAHAITEDDPERFLGTYTRDDGTYVVVASDAESAAAARVAVSDIPNVEVEVSDFTRQQVSELGRNLALDESPVQHQVILMGPAADIGGMEIVINKTPDVRAAEYLRAFAAERQVNLRVTIEDGAAVPSTQEGRRTDRTN